MKCVDIQLAVQLNHKPKLGHQHIIFLQIKKTATNPDQFELLVQFMEENVGIAKNFLNALQFRQTTNSLWNELKDCLKAAGPPEKTVDGWKKVTVSSEKCNKKTWGQRLKITKNNEKLSNESKEVEHNLNNNNQSNQSALSKSMKYAEPWLYGTVRGIPAPSVHHGQGIFGRFPHEVAVVVCSCPEYLNGTKREVKKATICKKCKGSRLPLAPIGGTVRIRPSPGMIHQSSRTSGGTMRLPPGSALIKQRARPSILDSQNDPYDLMRRSRLVSPELKPIQNNKKSRAKSISPLRSRSRSRKRSPSPNENSINIGNRSRSASRLNKISSPECWIDKLDPDPGGRRSILMYDVNPYDLLAKTTSNSSSEFSPINDDNFEYDLALHSKKYETILNPSHNGSMNSINNANSKRVSISSGASIIAGTTTSISGQRIRISSASRQLSTSSTSSNYEDANDFFYEHVQLRNPTPSDSSHINNYSNLTFNDSTSSNKDTIRPASQNSSTPTNSTSIKSILKRSSYHDTADENSSDNLKSKLIDKSSLNQISNKNISSSNSSNQSNISNSNSSSKKINRDRDKNNRNNSINNDSNNTNNNSNSSSQPNSNNISGSHFYLPLPTTRKKVQFLVDNDEVIQIPSSLTQTTQSHQEDAQSQCEMIENDVDDGYHNYSNVESNIDDYDDDEVFIGENNNSNNNSNSTSTSNNNIKLEITENRNEIEDNEVTNKDVVDKYLNNGYGENRKEIVETSDDGDYESSGTSTQIFPRRHLLRRSFSERRNSNNSDITKHDIVFLDTMALRMKVIRKDSRTLFARQHDDKIKSPVVVQDLPPESEPSPDYSENEKSSSDSSCCGYDDDNIYEDYSPTINVIVNNLKEPQQHKSKNINKTILTVSPQPPPPSQIIFNKESPAIHRLEIKHDEDITECESSKKTSIMISGDDCYSTVNVNNNTPIYQSSVVVNDEIVTEVKSGILKSSSNTITISVGATRTPDEEMIYQNNKINTLLSGNGSKSVIPIGNNRGGSTLIKLDYNDSSCHESNDNEITKLLMDPVEAVRRNLIPHVCGKTDDSKESKISEAPVESTNSIDSEEKQIIDRNSFISKLLEDPTLANLADGLDNELIAKLIENSLIRLKENRHTIDLNGTKDEESMTKLIDMSLEKIKEERQKILNETKVAEPIVDDNKDVQSNRDSVSSGNSYLSANYELFEFDKNGNNSNNNNTIDDLSDCYQSCSSELTADEDGNLTRSKFYQMLVDATLSEIEISTNIDDDHHYESIRLNGGDPIYEEITDIPPPLPLSAPPDIEMEKKNSRSIFEGASKYDILSYLVDAKERGIVPEESYAYNFSSANDIILEENTSDTIESIKKGKKSKNDLHARQNSDVSSRISHISGVSDSSMDDSSSLLNDKINIHRKSSADIERNDSGVGSETSKSCRSRYQISPNMLNDKNCPIHLCEDCDGTVETQITESGVLFVPLVCRKCAKKRAERKEIITEIVETEEKYGRDLQIILEEFYQPMLVAGLLTQDQLSAIFLNTEELLENNQALSERMRDTLDIANEQGDDDLLTVNIGRLILDAAPMLHAFESYCVRQAASSLLLANLEKEKELLRIFLRVSQMENTVLRRMNLNSFLMVPVQRVTKYPLLLARLYKVTPPHLDGREALKQAQEKIELHLNHMNREAKDVPTKLWRRISSSSPNRRSSCEIDMINIKLRKMAVDVLEWNHDEVRFAVEGRLLFTQPTDNNWRKGRTIKLTHVHALLVTNGKPSTNYKADRAMSEPLNFPRHTGIRESSLLLVREKGGRYTLLREPLYLDRCIVCTEADWDDYFEVQEISSKDTFIFKAEDSTRTKHWYTQLQYHAQGMGAWRKRRNALANIMINGMMTRT